VKGKREPARVYALLDTKDRDRAEEVQTFAEGVSRFRAQDWEAARAAFGACLQMRQSDGPASWYLTRIDHLAAHPPDADWDGVSVMETK